MHYPCPLICIISTATSTFHNMCPCFNIYITCHRIISARWRIIPTSEYACVCLSAACATLELMNTTITNAKTVKIDITLILSMTLSAPLCDKKEVEQEWICYSSNKSSPVNTWTTFSLHSFFLKPAKEIMVRYSAFFVLVSSLKTFNFLSSSFS